MNHEEKIITAVHEVFPDAVIGLSTKFSKGLTSLVYKVEIQNPDKLLSIKFFPKDLEARVEKSSQISNYLKENGLPTPKTYSIVKDKEFGWTVMDCMLGRVASEVWETASKDNRNIILKRSGSLLKKIHDLKIPPFWINEKHEITSQKEWVKWINIRIEKYLVAAEENLDKELIDFLGVKFTRLQKLYDVQPDFRFVPLHWDYHLSNINVDENFEISGIFDFDNTMKGHDMADIGQAVYWLIVNEKISGSEKFENFFDGYGKLSQFDREFIYLHFLLFLAGVMRSTWSKNHLKWLNKIHVGVLEKCVQGEYSIT